MTTTELNAVLLAFLQLQARYTKALAGRSGPQTKRFTLTADTNGKIITHNLNTTNVSAAFFDANNVFDPLITVKPYNGSPNASQLVAPQDGSSVSGILHLTGYPQAS